MINTNVMAKLMKKKDSIKLKKPIYIYHIHYIHFSKRGELCVCMCVCVWMAFCAKII
jgi:hypothetical protein